MRRSQLLLVASVLAAPARLAAQGSAPVGAPFDVRETTILRELYVEYGDEGLEAGILDPLQEQLGELDFNELFDLSCSDVHVS